MRLAPGARLGAYEVIGLLGAGGMGEVYRARDARLRRDVALKILPTGVSGDPARLARFEREARALAALNHPQIAAIYGVEEAEGVLALVLELVEGRSLAERLLAGPVSVRETLATARQIAEALDAAHEKGIVHRDLKPANLMLTPDGVVKVLDFGIAKMQATEEDHAEAAASTLTLETRPLVVLGTAAYMSPEQARGQALDKRTDIWAFGCVLYEMLTGRRPFGGTTISDTIAAIIEREPDWSRLPEGLPTGARRLLRQCLEKDPKRRLRDIGDVRLQLDEEPLSADPAPPTNPRRSFVSRLGWLAAGVALASAMVAGWLFWVSPTDAPARNVQFQRLTDFVGMEESPAISPDGSRVAFVARAGGKRQIWLRLLKGSAPHQITFDDVDHEQPRWAAQDSSSLIYFVPSATPGEHGTIWEIGALGGEPRPLATALSGGDLSHDGRRIALFRFDGTQIALVVVTRDGSVAEQVTPMPPDSSYEYPRWSPDDHWIAFQRDSLAAVFDERVFVVPMAPGGAAREIARGTNLSGLSWLPDGSGVVYSSSAGSTLLYPPLFNLRAVEREGTGDRQLTFGDVSYVEPDVHVLSGMVTGSLIRMQSDIWKFPVNGSPAENTRRGLRITHQTGQAQTPSVSPDESEVVYLSDNGGHSNLWVARTDGSGVPRQITFERDPAISVGVPMWSPTGNEIVFIVTQAGMTGLSLVNRDATGLRPFVPLGISASWSADGRWVYYSRPTAQGLCIEKAAIEGGPAISVRCGNANASVPTLDGTLYFVNLLIKSNGTVDHEIGRARPENGPSSVLDRVRGSRVPVNRRYFLPVLSPDGLLLTAPLTDGSTSNIWVKPTNGDDMRALTDFGDRSVVIARRVSWSRSKHIYAAVAETDADIVLLSGLVGAR